MKAVNLLPSDQRTASVSSGAAKTSAATGDAFGAYVVLGALVLAVVGLAAYVLAGNTIKDRKAELARVSAEAAATEAKAAELAPYAEFQALAQSRVATVTGLAQSRFDWERALGDLSRAIPSNVHLKSIKGSVSSNGGGGNQLRGAVQSPAIELSGCTDSQKSVAALMSRLRAVRGVTRVSLARSDKGGALSLAPVVAGTEGDRVEVLCKGAPPSFEMVMFFERAALPAAAQPTGAAPAAAPPGGNGTPSTQTAQPAAPGTQAGTTGQPSTPPTNGAQPAPATQGVSAP